MSPEDSISDKDLEEIEKYIASDFDKAPSLDFFQALKGLVARIRQAEKKLEFHKELK